MPYRVTVALAVTLLVPAHSPAQHVPKLAPYPLPPKAREALLTVAAGSDVLVLGETHGTQEVPAVAAALLDPLWKLGYGMLALEVPSDQQQPLTDWAAGKAAVPDFFRHPAQVEDGRGNKQVLGLIRAALSPPRRWRLVCFDAAARAVVPWGMRVGVKGRGPAPPSPDEIVAASVRRDAAMAAMLGGQRKRHAPDARVLAICGNIHARTSAKDRSGGKGRGSGDMVGKIWPSFAAALQADNPGWRVRSVNVVPHGGGFYAIMATDGGKAVGGVHPVRSKKTVNEAAVHPLRDDSWDWEMDLPRATPATFLMFATADAPTDSPGR